MRLKILILIALFFCNSVSLLQIENKEESLDKSLPMIYNEVAYKEERFYPAICNENFEWKYIVKDTGIGQCIHSSEVKIEGASYASQIATPMCPEKSQWVTANSRLRVGKCIKETNFIDQYLENDQIFPFEPDLYTGPKAYQNYPSCDIGYHQFQWSFAHKNYIGKNSYIYYTHHKACVRDSSKFCQHYKNSVGRCLSCLAGYTLTDDLIRIHHYDECISYDFLRFVLSLYINILKRFMYGFYIIFGFIFLACAFGFGSYASRRRQEYQN